MRRFSIHNRRISSTLVSRAIARAPDEEAVNQRGKRTI